MSNIYIQEPPSNGKVLVKTSVGDIDVELWSKEAPKSCRNFVQLCLEGYYDGTAFHRVVKEFIVQGGDPTDTGHGGESVYGAPFKDEFHSRLRFVRRGLVAMANAGPHDNGSQFFFTMAATPELQNKHTIFGKVVGDTLYNMLKLQEVEVNEATERPTHPHRIISTEVLNNPFDDIIPRQIKKIKKDKEEEKKIKSKSKATKNFSLLSFGDEAEDDEEQVDKATESFRGKSKSSHDLTDDPRLSSVPALDRDPDEEKRKKKVDESPEEPATKKIDSEEPDIKVKLETKTLGEEEGKKKTDAIVEETKKVKPELKEDDKKKRQSDIPEVSEKKKSPGVEEGEGKRKKGEGEEEGKKAMKEMKEEVKEEVRKKKDVEPPLDSKKRKSEDAHRDDRKKRSRDRDEEERRKRKTDSKEEESRKRRKGEERTGDGEKEDKKKARTEGTEASSQPSEADKSAKDEVQRKLKTDKEEAPPSIKDKEPRSLLAFEEDEKRNRMEEIKKEQRKLQRDIKDFKKRSQSDAKVKVKPQVTDNAELEEEEGEDSDLLAMVKKERQKYKSRKKEMGHRKNREQATLDILAKFQSKLSAARTLAGDYDDMDDEKTGDDNDDPEDMSWMHHKLHCQTEEIKTKVIDANVHDNDRYALNDPRNPLTQRRRETSKKAMRDKR